MPKRRNEESEEDYLKRKMKRYKKKLEELSMKDDVEKQPHVAEKEIVAEEDNELPEDNVLIEDNQLPEEFLLALGSEGAEKEVRGDEIRPELANRWIKLMSNGLGKDAQEAIFKKYPTPSNFDSAEAPKVNPEILASLSQITVKRDMRIVHRQNLTGKVMCALGKTLTSILKGDINSKLIIEQVNDAAKLCAEIYYQDSSSRKFFALAGADQTIKDAVRDSKPDKFLFGINCAENIKAAQAIKKTGSQIKAADSTPQHSATNTKPSKQQPTSKKQGNWRGPPQQFHQRARGGHRPHPTRKYHQHQRDQKRDKFILCINSLPWLQACYQGSVRETRCPHVSTPNNVKLIVS
ncbi:uncharacterized protein LOC134674838 [Cydia fagiglandana]|uniref:uncharacterized protein LOC134674838 n=1 Tax=Cydia fagiglandana TaxID=1458189 RepID=UPI002FEE5C04